MISRSAVSNCGYFCRNYHTPPTCKRTPVQKVSLLRLRVVRRGQGTDVAGVGVEGGALEGPREDAVELEAEARPYLHQCRLPGRFGFCDLQWGGAWCEHPIAKACRHQASQHATPAEQSTFQSRRRIIGVLESLRHHTFHKGSVFVFLHIGAGWFRRSAKVPAQPGLPAARFHAGWLHSTRFHGCGCSGQLDALLSLHFHTRCLRLRQRETGRRGPRNYLRNWHHAFQKEHIFFFLLIGPPVPPRTLFMGA